MHLQQGCFPYPYPRPFPRPGLITFHGFTGPYDSYGRNAAYNKYTFGDNIDSLNFPEYQTLLTPTRNIKHVLDYASEYNSHYNTDDVAGLNRDEYYNSIYPFSHLFNDEQLEQSQNTSDRIFVVLDTDKNNNINVTEQAAFQIFQNAPATWINRYTGLRIPSGPFDRDDGLVTPRERYNTASIMQLAPKLVQNTLKFIINKLNLNQAG